MNIIKLNKTVVEGNPELRRARVTIKMKENENRELVFSNFENSRRIKRVTMKKKKKKVAKFSNEHDNDVINYERKRYHREKDYREKKVIIQNNF